MAAGSIAQRLGTLSLAGSYVPSGEKKRKLDEVYAGENIRSTLDGGRFGRPGQEDTAIDLSSFNFTNARGFFGSKVFPLLWVAGDDGTNVKIIGCDPDDLTAFDCGLTLTTAKRVHMMEFEGDIYYANGTNSSAPGRIIVSAVDTGGVAAASTTLNLTPGTGYKFATSGTALIGTDTFSWTGKTADQLTGVTGMLAHDAGAIVMDTATNAATTLTKPSIVAQWFFSLNFGGDTNKPRIWEFSRFATAANPERFYDFAAGTTGTEIVGEGSEISGFHKTNNYFYIFKKDSIHFVARADVNVTSGVRPPLELSPDFGIPNPWCVTAMNGILAFLTNNKRLLPIQIVTENVNQTLKIEANFDKRVRSYLSTIDKDQSDAFVFFNPQDQLLKVGVKVDSVREILVYDAQLDIFYPPDTGKDYDFMAELDGKSYGYSTEGSKIYLDEVGTFDDTVPVDWEWETGRVGGEFVRSAHRDAYLHGKMTSGSICYVDIFIGGEQLYTKTLDDSYIKTSVAPAPVGHGGIGTAGIAGAGADLSAREFQMPIGAYKHGQDIKLKFRRGSEDGGDFVQFDGISFGVTPRSKVPFAHA